MAKGQAHTQLDRERAIIAYATEGMYSKAAKIVKIPAETIRCWHNKYPEEWERITEYYREELEDKRRAALEKVATKGLEVTLDGLTNGDERINTKTGEKIRVQVGAKDAATITGIMVDKLRISLGKPTSITAGKAETSADRLQELRQAARQQAIDAGHIQDISPKTGTDDE